MPNIKSAIKRVKVAEKKTKRNNMIKSECKTAIKKYEVANSNGEEEAIELLSKAKSKIDSACSKGVISKNAASRKKSKLDTKLAVKPAAKKAEKKVEAKVEKPAEEKAEKVDEKEAKKETPKKATTKKTTKKED